MCAPPPKKVYSHFFLENEMNEMAEFMGSYKSLGEFVKLKLCSLNVVNPYLVNYINWENIGYDLLTNGYITCSEGDNGYVLIWWTK